MSKIEKNIRELLLEILAKLSEGGVKSKNEIDNFWLKLNQLQARSQVEIRHIQFQGEGDPFDEHIVLHNRGELTINISGWRIEAGSPDQTFIFPEGSFLLPDESLNVETLGNGQFSFDSNQPIWNNRGDVARLIDAQGALISSFAYGNKAHQYVTISHIHVDGKKYRTEGDEFVELINLSEHRIDLDGWQLEAMGNRSRFVFQFGAKLEAFTGIKVFTQKSPLEADEYSFDSTVAIWNNQSGGCRLLDYQNSEVSSYHY
ncbi:lamin tail domain-containing protein [Vibrio ostreicida]|uniref:lamin tail domain-containing protein n=1 Tax=Vibrio ostreicida TaxID=526588 RepID=UPI003B5C38DD